MKPAKVGVAGMQKKKKKASGLEVMLLGFCFFCCIESKEPVLLPPSLCCRDYQCISFFFFLNFTRQLATTVGYFGVALLGVNIAI